MLANLSHGARVSISPKKILRLWDFVCYEGGGGRIKHLEIAVQGTRLKNRNTKVGHVSKYPTLSKYKKEVVDEILSRIAAGEFVSHICKEPHLPSNRIVAEWRYTYPEFAAAYLEARRAQAQSYAERGVMIALDTDAEFAGKDAHTRRLGYDAMRWMAGKLNPREYGDRTIVAGDEEAPLYVETKRRDELRKLTYEERKAIQKMVAAAKDRPEPAEIEGEVEDDET